MLTLPLGRIIRPWKRQVLKTWAACPLLNPNNMLKGHLQNRRASAAPVGNSGWWLVLLLSLKSYTVERGCASLSWHPSKKSWAAGAELRERESSAHCAGGAPAPRRHWGSLQHSVSPATHLGALLVHSTKLIQHSDEVIALSAPIGRFQAGHCLLFCSDRLSATNYTWHLERVKDSVTVSVGGIKVLQLLQRNKAFRYMKNRIQTNEACSWIFNSMIQLQRYCWRKIQKQI